MNVSQSLRHADNPMVRRIGEDGGLALDEIQEKKRIGDVPKAFVQGQGAGSADSKTRDRVENAKFKRCGMTIVVGAMNTQDDTADRTALRLALKPIDIGRHTAGQPAGPPECRRRQVVGDHRPEGVVWQV